ncbi:hypothetical protein [Plasmodium yoelii yoelii]|uniref:Uncharacterized protein n=1 Tax=Plasmodium yoelii yoelii TaxID=73239 RepID=Q7RMU1_PLAYO|nr:hypothetical protein [Plasmodium yoelii yoelii]
MSIETNLLDQRKMHNMTNSKRISTKINNNKIE